MRTLPLPALLLPNLPLLFVLIRKSTMEIIFERQLADTRLVGSDNRSQMMWQLLLEEQTK